MSGCQGWDGLVIFFLLFFGPGSFDRSVDLVGDSGNLHRHVCSCGIVSGRCDYGEIFLDGFIYLRRYLLCELLENRNVLCSVWIFPLCGTHVASQGLSIRITCDWRSRLDESAWTLHVEFITCSALSLSLSGVFTHPVGPIRRIDQPL